MNNLLGLEEVLGIAEEHLLDTRVEYDGGYGPLVAGIRPAPTAMRVRKVDLYTVDGLGLVLLLRLKHELFQNRIVACHNTAGKPVVSPPCEP